eukprot:3553096-Lingulodinium_polyedra.AAC.1
MAACCGAGPAPARPRGRAGPPWPTRSASWPTGPSPSRGCESRTACVRAAAWWSAPGAAGACRPGAAPPSWAG